MTYNYIGDVCVLYPGDESVQSQSNAAAANALLLCSFVVSAVSLSAVVSLIFYMFVKFRGKPVHFNFSFLHLFEPCIARDTF